MTVHNFWKKPGDPLMQSQEDPEMLLLMPDGKPDWIDVPDAIPDHAGRHRCLGLETAPCVGPECDDHDATHYVLDCPVRVCECTETGLMYWYVKARP